MIKERTGGVTTPQGFRASGVHCGIKADPEAFDLGILCSDVPASVAGVFTANRVKGAPVLLSMSRVQRGSARAVIVNSGNANVCTGAAGMADAGGMAALAAAKLGVAEEDVLVASTGVIGRKLPMDRIRPGIALAAGRLSADGPGGLDFARAIMTTDRAPKEAAVSFSFGRGAAAMGGTIKGAGMIAPNMATMLCFVTTDAAIEPAPLRSALAQAVEGTLNRITVDGHMSTSDTVLLLANGKIGSRPLAEESGRDFERLVEALTYLLARLGEMLVSQAEGVTKLVRITVDGAASRQEAETIARTVAGSPLVKTALHGADPNWGRIVSAAGMVASFDPTRARLVIGMHEIFADGEPKDVPLDAVRTAMLENDVAIRLSLGSGRERYTILTSDLSEEYVSTNADYTT